jgi:antitoxin (DNA-binding transcriptional repressor) of toxin-antitoxin stability system
MRTAQVSELKDRLDEVIEAVKNGETVAIQEGVARVARVVPDTDVAPSVSSTDQDRVRQHIEKLIREGKAHRGTGKLPDDFFTRPRPKFEEGSVLEQLLRDREED